MPDDASEVRVRVMRADEYEHVRALEIAAFGDDDSIGTLLDLLHSSWSWEDGLSFVAEQDGGDGRADVFAHVLFTRAIVDAPERLVDVLVLSPVGVRPDLHGRGIGTQLIAETLRLLAATRPEPLVFLLTTSRAFTFASEIVTESPNRSRASASSEKVVDEPAVRLTSTTSQTASAWFVPAPSSRS